MPGMFIGMDSDHKVKILGFGHYGFWMYNGILEVITEWLNPSGREPVGGIRNIFKYELILSSYLRTRGYLVSSCSMSQGIRKE